MSAESTEKNLLGWLWGVSEASLLCYYFQDSGMFQRMQSTILVVYCQGSERAH